MPRGAVGEPEHARIAGVPTTANRACLAEPGRNCLAPGQTARDHGAMSSTPVAAGTRIAWDDVPRHVRAAVEHELGSPITEAVTQHGGFSPGAAVRVACRSGRRAFVKAVGLSLNPDSPGLHRAEIRAMSQLRVGAPAPKLLALLRRRRLGGARARGHRRPPAGPALAELGRGADVDRARSAGADDRSGLDAAVPRDRAVPRQLGQDRGRPRGHRQRAARPVARDARSAVVGPSGQPQATRWCTSMRARTTC